MMPYRVILYLRAPGGHTIDSSICGHGEHAEQADAESCAAHMASAQDLTAVVYKRRDKRCAEVVAQATDGVVSRPGEAGFDDGIDGMAFAHWRVDR